MYHYKSEAAQFLDKPMEDNPKWKRNASKPPLLWDVTLNPTEQAEFEAAKVNKNPIPHYQDSIPNRRDDQHAQYRIQHYNITSTASVNPNIPF